MTDHEFKAPERTARAVSKDGCWYTLYEPDGSYYPCDRPAVGYRWYQDVGEHEDLLDVACEIHRNAGGDRMAELMAEVERLTGERDRARGLAARLEAQVARVEELADPAIDVIHLDHQRQWSRDTFGPGPRTAGVLDHIRKELAEIEADPTDLTEWVDLIILAFDGAWRHGAEPSEIIAAIKAKQARNESRSWPDWRTAEPGKAIEHIAEAGGE